MLIRLELPDSIGGHDPDYVYAEFGPSWNNRWVEVRRGIHFGQKSEISINWSAIGSKSIEVARTFNHIMKEAINFATRLDRENKTFLPYSAEELEHRRLRIIDRWYHDHPEAKRDVEAGEVSA